VAYDSTKNFGFGFGSVAIAVSRIEEEEEITSFQPHQAD
jgi:hypothetical protein